MRIDLELVNRKLFESRTKAQNAIKSGHIYLNGKKITQSSLEVSNDDIITIKGNPLRYVSKGGLKLEKILKEAKIDLVDKIMIDVGASTGGFTDCALQNHIKKVYAIDVGINQLHCSLKENPLVCPFEYCDFRYISNDLISDASISTIDVSFISSIKLLDKLNELPNIKEIILLIKPQFECGKEIADKYMGIINNRDVHYNVILKVINEYAINGYYINYLTFSPIKGSKGNIEYLAYFTTNSSIKFDIDKKGNNKSLLYYTNNNSGSEINVRKIVNEAFKTLNKDKKNFYKYAKKNQ